MRVLTDAETDTPCMYDTVLQMNVPRIHSEMRIKSTAQDEKKKKGKSLEGEKVLMQAGICNQSAWRRSRFFPLTFWSAEAKCSSAAQQWEGAHLRLQSHMEIQTNVWPWTCTWLCVAQRRRELVEDKAPTSCNFKMHAQNLRQFRIKFTLQFPADRDNGFHQFDAVKHRSKLFGAARSHDADERTSHTLCWFNPIQFPS